MMSFYKNQGYDIKNYPVTFDNYAREISLPVYYDLKDELVQRVIKAVVESVEKVLS
jgi:dTDP-4-amino-4,6-dideoxygalactose transaminase